MAAWVAELVAAGAGLDIGSRPKRTSLMVVKFCDVHYKEDSRQDNHIIHCARTLGLGVVKGPDDGNAACQHKTDIRVNIPNDETDI
jgi:hypothetical protein